MKKIVIGLFLCLIFLTGCGNNEKNYKEILQGYAKEYYEKHMIGVDNQQQAVITIEMLKKANEYGDDYDLSKLKKCKDTTSVIINLNDNKEAVSYEYNLKCD